MGLQRPPDLLVEGGIVLGGGDDNAVGALRPVDLVVTELAVIAFPNGHATLIETAPDVSVERVLEATEAELIGIFAEATRLEAEFWSMGWRAGLPAR